MPKKIHKTEEMVAKVRQVEARTAQGKPVAEAVHRLNEIAIELDPEHGRLTVFDLGEDGTKVFTRFGIDNLAELVPIYSDPRRLDANRCHRPQAHGDPRN
jgi:hypothetical protein